MHRHRDVVPNTSYANIEDAHFMFTNMATIPKWSCGFGTLTNFKTHASHRVTSERAGGGDSDRAPVSRRPARRSGPSCCRPSARRLPAKLLVGRLVDDAHPPFAELRDDAEMRERLAYELPHSSGRLPRLRDAPPSFAATSPNARTRAPSPAPSLCPRSHSGAWRCPSDRARLCTRRRRPRCRPSARAPGLANTERAYD